MATLRLTRDPVYANGIALVANSAIASVLGFAYWIVMAHRFDSAAIGWGAAVVSAATLAALLGKAGFDAAIIRYAPGASPRETRRLVAAGCLVAVSLTALFGLAFLALALDGVASLAPLRGSPAAAVGFLLLACGTALAWIFDAFFIAQQDARFTLYRNVAFNLVKLAAPLAVVAALASFAVPITWGLGLVVSVAVALVLMPRAMRDVREDEATAHLPRATRREMLTYSAKTYVLNVSEFLPGLLLPILVLETMGPVVNARFFLAWTIATVGFLASKAIAQSGFAALVRNGPVEPALAKGARLSALLLLPFAAFLLVGAPVLLAIFRQGGHADAIALVRLLAVSLIPLAVTNLYLAFLKARRARWELTLLPAATLVAVVALAPAALAWGGIAGLGALWLGVQLAAGAWSLARLLTILRSQMPHDQDLRPRARIGHRPHEG